MLVKVNFIQCILLSGFYLKKDISPKTHEGTLRQLANEYVKTGLLSKESYDFLYNGRETRKIPAMTIQKFFQRKKLKTLFYKM